MDDMLSTRRSSILCLIMHWFMRILLLFLFIIKVICQMDTNNYGPYRNEWVKFETCKGPKQGECGKFEIKNAQNMSDVVFLLDFPKDCPVMSAKIVVSTLSNNVTKRLWNYALNKPCEHFVLGPILFESFNLTKNCRVNKGRYEVHLDFQAKARMFLGTSFFYGTYIFKTMSYNKVNNFFCVNTEVDVKKAT